MKTILPFIDFWYVTCLLFNIEKLFNKDESDNNTHIDESLCERIEGSEDALMKEFTKEKLQTVFKTLKSKGKSVYGISPNDLRLYVIERSC